MSFNINDFIQNTADGFFREAHFSVELTLPPILSEFASNGLDRQVSFLCNAAEIPGRELRTTTISRYGLGLYQPFAVGTQYEPLTLEFYCDAKGDTLKVFHTWLDRVFPPSSDGAGNKKNALHVEFPDNYICPSLSVFQHNVKGDKIIEWKFYDAFPKALGSSNLSWASRNSFVIMKVIFAYAYYERAGTQDTINTIEGPPRTAQNNQLPQKSVIPINPTPIAPLNVPGLVPGGGSFGSGAASGSR